MFALSSISSSLELWSINHISIHENSKLKFYKNINFLGEMSNNWRSDILGTTVKKTLESCW